jgi:hypothetical protein
MTSSSQVNIAQALPRLGSRLAPIARRSDRSPNGADVGGRRLILVGHHPIGPCPGHARRHHQGHGRREGQQLGRTTYRERHGSTARAGRSKAGERLAIRFFIAGLLLCRSIGHCRHQPHRYGDIHRYIQIYNDGSRGCQPTYVRIDRLDRRKPPTWPKPNKDTDVKIPSGYFHVSINKDTGGEFTNPPFFVEVS